MAAHNKIGEFEFLSLVGNPDPVKRQVEVMARAAVDGVSIARLGVRGAQFMLTSKVDQADRPTARQTFLRYRNLIGQNPVQLKWWQIDMAGESFRVAVLDVRQIECRRLLVSAGGLNPPGLAYLICEWDLIAIPY